MWIDTHCHFNDICFDTVRDELIDRLRLLKIDLLIIPAVRAADFYKVAAVARQYSCVYTLGLHPWVADEVSGHDVDFLHKSIYSALSDPFFVGIGEIGLDFFRSIVPMNKQIELFIAQLKIAKEFDLPVICHACKSIDLVVKYLRSVGINKGILHAFNGNLRQAESLIRQGIKLGFGGSVTCLQAKKMRKLAIEIPIDSIVLETDAPYLRTKCQRMMNCTTGALCLHSPECLICVAEIIALLRGMSLNELAFCTTKNVANIFSRLSDKYSV